MTSPSEQKKEDGTKYDAEKLRYDLIPVAPMAEVARVYTIGARKYDDRNWEKGISYSRVVGAMKRHLEAWWGGEVWDKEGGQHHLASVVWGALALMEYERTHPEKDDRPDTARPYKVDVGFKVFPWPAPGEVLKVGGTN